MSSSFLLSLISTCRSDVEGPLWGLKKKVWGSNYDEGTFRLKIQRFCEEYPKLWLRTKLPFADLAL